MVAVDQVPGEPPHNDGRYAMDIRLFIAIVTLTMTLSFMAGMYGVTESYSHNGGSYKPSYLEAMALRFLFPNLIPADLGLATADKTDPSSLDVLNHSDVVQDNDVISEHRPSGQHLLVDIKGVDADFLNSEELLSKALVDAVKETGYVDTSFR
jgi:hypothetical protein